MKALIEFESELSGAKTEVQETKKRMIRQAETLAESAKSRAVSQAQRQASEKLAKARVEAEQQAESIRKQGETSLRAFEASISTKKKKAAEMVVNTLLGEKR